MQMTAATLWNLTSTHLASWVGLFAASQVLWIQPLSHLGSGQVAVSLVQALLEV